MLCCPGMIQIGEDGTGGDAMGQSEAGTLIRVMIAEDMELLREDFAETVNGQADMEVVGTAATGAEIIRLAAEQACDVVLMDIEMETMTAGITAAEQIYEHYPHTRVVFLTAHETEEMITGAMGTGAVDYVVKGCDDEVLIRHIRQAYEGETALEPQIRQTVMQEYARLRRSERSLIFFINNVAKLTPAEHELVRFLLQNKKNAEIAKLRCVELVTVKTQIRKLLNKFGCSRSREIVELIREMKLEHLFK